MPQTKTISTRTVLNLLGGDLFEIKNKYVPEPDPVTDLSVTPGYGENVLNWTADVNTSYIVQASADEGSTWETLITTPDGGDTHTHSGLLYRTTRQYRVIPLFNSIQGQVSNVATGTTLIRIEAVGSSLGSLNGNLFASVSQKIGTKIYAFPFDREFGVSFDVVTDTTTNMTGSYPDNDSFGGSAQSPDGTTVYVAPNNTNFFGKLNVATNALSNIGSNLSSANGFHYLGFLRHSNGYYYAAPLKAARCVVLDPSDDSTTLFGTTFSGEDKFSSIIEVPGGKMYALPRYSNVNVDRFLKIDPNIDPLSPTTTLFGPTYTGNNKFRSFHLAPNGFVYVIPDGLGKILKINPLDDSITEVVTGLSVSAYSTALLEGTKLYLPPFNASRCGVLDTSTDTFIEVGSSLSGLSKYRSFTKGGNGRLYATPFNASRFLELNLADNTTTLVGPSLGITSAKFLSTFKHTDENMSCVPFNESRFYKLTTL